MQVFVCDGKDPKKADEEEACENGKEAVASIQNVKMAGRNGAAPALGTDCQKNGIREYPDAANSRFTRQIFRAEYANCVQSTVQICAGILWSAAIEAKDNGKNGLGTAPKLAA